MILRVFFVSPQSTSLLHLQSQIDELTAERDFLEQSKSHHTTLMNDKSKKLEDTLEKLKEARNELVEKQEEFRKEMMTQTKLSKLYKSSLDETNSKNVLLEGFLLFSPFFSLSFSFCLLHTPFFPSEQVQEQEEALQKATAEIYTLREQRAQSQETFSSKVIEREKELDQLRSQLRHANELLANFTAPQAQQHPDVLSSTAQAAARLQKSGLTFTHVVRQPCTISVNTPSQIITRVQTSFSVRRVREGQ